LYSHRFDFACLPRYHSECHRLVSGEHNVAVKKSGYKTWQRKIKLSGGEIKINAELEKN